MKKHDQPYMPFYIGDWKKAPEIKALSLSARGLWVEMLFLMWESTERGYLTINGIPMSVEVLARQVGFACDLLEPLLTEMRTFAVFSVREDGAIFSRKMVKDAEISLKRSYAGQKGGICSSKSSSKFSAKHTANADNETDIDNENDINLSLKKEVQEETKPEPEKPPEPPKPPKQPRPEWMEKFEVYEKMASDAWDRIVSDHEWMQERKRYHPNLDLRLTLEKAYNDFWGTKAGWKNKKDASRGKANYEIDWDSTYKNALTLKGNHVYAKERY